MWRWCEGRRQQLGTIVAGAFLYEREYAMQDLKVYRNEGWELGIGATSSRRRVLLQREPAVGRRLEDSQKKVEASYSGA